MRDRRVRDSVDGALLVMGSCPFPPPLFGPRRQRQGYEAEGESDWLATVTTAVRGRTGRRDVNVLRRIAGMRAGMIGNYLVILALSSRGSVASVIDET